MGKCLPSLPPAVDWSYPVCRLDDPGRWLVLSDCHFPYHDRAAVEAALATARRRKVAGVLLNGDTADSHELSDFDKDPTAPRYVAERECVVRFLAHLRGRFPRARIVWKDGNHEDRLRRYLVRRAPALFGLECVTLPAIMRLADFGVEHVGDKRVVRLGKLNVVHGHEYPGGASSPVNPARGLFLRARSVAMCGHRHQTSEHHEPDITGQAQAAWSTGCLCQLTPAYMPLNRWNHGFAIVEVDKGGMFAVQNLRVMNGKVL